VTGIVTYLSRHLRCFAKGVRRRQQSRHHARAHLLQSSTVEYVRDAAAQALRKALILVGHEVSEKPGMEYCAAWLTTVLPGMGIEFVPAGSPFAKSVP
jgi:putative NIF3 family GTP cyclohydrolase 1 type 2